MFSEALAEAKDLRGEASFAGCKLPIKSGPVAQRLEQPRMLSGLVTGDVLCFTP